MSILPEGAHAPDFVLPSTPEKRIALKDFRGRNVVLVFYPADFSPVCSDQLPLYSQLLPEFGRLDAAVVGISVDGVWCHKAFTESRKLRFPLLADFEPKGAVSRAYGAYHEADGTSERALFVVDGDGMIRWSYLSPLGVNPGADGILDALERMHGAAVAAPGGA